jgi:Cd2+/Zn2+-exporting ATPase
MAKKCQSQTQNGSSCGCGNYGSRNGGNGKRKIVQLSAGASLLIAAWCIKDSAVQPYIFLASYAILGWKVVYTAFRNLLRGKIFDENFLMTIATGGAFAICEFPEAAAVMLFYSVGELFQDMAVRKSRKSIAGLMDIRPDFANVYADGRLTRVSPDDVKIGDTIIVKPGEKIPLDGVITDGASALDTRALTGESVPKNVGVSEEVFSGSVNLNGVLTVRATKIFGESTAAKIIALAESAGAQKAPTENFITAFSRCYTPAVVALAVLLALIPPLFFAGIWNDWIYRALVFLMISCPCALVISIPLGFFGGIGRASRNGILVKGGNYLEALNSLDTVVFDKTGTLTKGVFEVTGIYPADGFTNDNLLEYAATAETFSNHPVAASIKNAYGKSINEGIIIDFKEIAGHGTSVITTDKKHILAGNAKLMRLENIGITENHQYGTKIYVAADGGYAGCIVISDGIKPDSRAAVAGLKELGVRKTVMLTGDDRRTAEAIANDLSIDEVHAQLLPHQKVEIVERLESEKHPRKKMAFVGDGINDAPVLARADIGIAMGGLGSDAAIEAADIVLMTDEPSKIITAIKIAKDTRRIVWQNIIFAMSVKGVFLTLGATGISGLWEAVIADVGVSLLATLNAVRTMRYNSRCDPVL